MTNRRHFLGYVSALAGTYILTACGGESGDGDTSVASVAAAQANAVTSASANGTTILPASSIIDNSASVWTVSRGVVYKNGAAAGSTSNVSLLLWYGGMIYQCGTGGQFYVWTSAGIWLGCSDPRIAVAATAGHFYGVNGHYDYAFTPAEVISMMKLLRCTTYRVNMSSDPIPLAATLALAKAFQAADLNLFVMIDQKLYDANGKLFASETAAYNAAYTDAVTVATALKPYGVTMYECGNELTRDPAIILNSTASGNNVTDFNNTNWPIMRGVMNGLICGIKSVQSTARCGINFCVADIGASDALWDGAQPDGSTGHPQIHWDITTWHNYQVYGNLFEIGTDGAGPEFNLPVYCKARYGMPFMVTEWNANPEETEAFRGTYIAQQLGQFYPARKTDNIESVMYYELDSGDDTWGMVTNSGAPIDPPYSTFLSFAAANPDT